MALVTLHKLVIRNLGPVVEDEVELSDFTFFIGRNNAGKSHYVKAIELLLASKNPSSSEVVKLLHNNEQPLEIEGVFSGVAAFTELVSGSNHQQAITNAIDADGNLCVVRKIGLRSDQSEFGIKLEDGTIHNPTGFQTNLLKILPEVISIPATADTVDELKNTQSTALSKLKREVLSVFFEELKVKTQTTLTELDEFLHGTGNGQRSERLSEFEQNLHNELTGEFADVVPSVEFGLPDQEIIAKEMKIFLDDGHKSEVEQKGHGLQRAALLALLKVLAKHGERYQNKPTPIFLIGELESFLHPYAQMQFGDVLLELVEQYQIVTTTHSPFIISERSISGYRRVVKDAMQGAHVTAPKLDEMDLSKVKSTLSLRGNLEALFADRVVLIEGQNDLGCYEHLMQLFKVASPTGKLMMFSFVTGKGSLHATSKFYRQLGMDDVSIIADLDYLVSDDICGLLDELSVDTAIPTTIRNGLHLTSSHPSLSDVLAAIETHGRPSALDEAITTLASKRVFIVRDGAPENYYTSTSSKDGWRTVSSEDDLSDPVYLKNLLEKVCS